MNVVSLGHNYVGPLKRNARHGFLHGIQCCNLRTINTLWVLMNFLENYLFCRYLKFYKCNIFRKRAPVRVNDSVFSIGTVSWKKDLIAE